MALRAELVEEAERLEPLRAGWDELAIALGRPYCAPGWMLSWWRAAAPRDAVPRVGVVREGDALVGVLPFWCRPDRQGGGRYALMAEGTSYPVEPLARPGSERQVAAAFGEVLALSRPAPREIALTGVPGRSPWPRLLEACWPGPSPAFVARTRTERLPAVELGRRSPDAWLSGRSRNFRQQVRRSRRALTAAGGRFRVSTLATLDEDLESLSRLHHARWSWRGGSRALDAQVEQMLRLAGRELLPAGRLSLRSIEVDGRTISSHLFVTAGGVEAYWLGGFDDEFAAWRPSILVLVTAVEDAIRRGARRLELGPGAQAYKYRLADGDEALEWLTIGARAG